MSETNEQQSQPPTTAAIQRTPMAFEPSNMDDAWRMAKLYAESNLMPGHLRGNPANIVVTIAYGRELGLSPIQSIMDIFVVNGKPGTSAGLVVAQCLKHRDQCAYFVLVETTDEKAVYETMRVGAPMPTRMEFTLAQATRAGLRGDNWSKYPAAMLRARCSSHLARAVYPDLVRNVYDRDEVIEMEETERGFTVPPPPPKRPVIVSVDADGVISERPVASDEQDGPPSEARLRALLEAATSRGDVITLAPAVRLYAGDDKQHSLRTLYDATLRRVSGRDDA